jgi:hypothetical protein
MPIYQLYLFDAGGHLKQAVELECGSDTEAKVYVEGRREPWPMELWSCGRVVEQYPAAA